MVTRSAGEKKHGVTKACFPRHGLLESPCPQPQVSSYLGGRAKEGALTGPRGQHHFLLALLEDGPCDASIEGD